MTRKPLIAGHSHITALGLGFLTDDGSNKAIPMSDERFEGLAGTWPRNPGYVEALIEAAEDRTIFLFWCGNQHLSQFLFAPEVMFDVVLSSEPDLPVVARAELIPESALLSFFGSWDRLPEVLARLAEVEGARVVVCGTPPPCPSDDHLLRIMRSQPVWSRMAAERGLLLDDARLSPPILRYKTWVVLQAKLARIAEAGGALFSPVPNWAKDENGCLREAFWADATHAGGDYGRLMRDHLISTFMDAQ